MFVNIKDIIFKKTNVSGRLPNTTDPLNSSYIARGQFSFNTNDKKMFSSNGTHPFEIGSNLSNINVSNNATLVNIIANNTAIVLLTINSLLYLPIMINNINSEYVIQ